MTGKLTRATGIILITSLAFIGLFSSCNKDSKNYTMAHDTTLSAEVRAWSQKILDDPSKDEYYAERAMVLISNDHNFKLAIEDLETALKMKPDKSVYLIKLADAYFGANKTYKARDMYLRAINENPKDAEILFKTGRFFLFVKNYDDAKRYLNEALKIDESYPKVYFFLGQIFKETQDTTRAIEFYKKAIQIDAGDYDAYLQLGQIYTNQNSSEALRYLDAAINTNDGIDEAWYARGYYYQQHGNNAKALFDYQKTITINPFHAYAFYNAGYIYFSLENWALATRHFELAFKANDTFDKPIYMLGLTQEAQNKFPEAIVYYKRCLQLNPNFELAKAGLQRLENKK
jgi:tetratricopeptide (TPR) repeat protein